MQQWWLTLVGCSVALASAAQDLSHISAEPLPVDPHYATAYKLPNWVSQVQSLCPWQSKSDDILQGHIRLIHGQFAEGDKLYLQWIKKTANQGEEIISTREVEELAQLPLSLQNFQSTLASEHCLLSIEATSKAERRPYRLELQLHEPGQYRYQQAAQLNTEL